MTEHRAILWGLSGAVAAFVGLLLAAERDRRRTWAGKAVWVAKPAASAGFVMLGLLGLAPGAPWQVWMVAALGASFLGDVLLVPVGAPRAFKGGIAAFAGAHVAFCGGFLALGVHWSAVGATAVVLFPVAWGVARWLLPHVPQDLKIPVSLYIGVIGSMVCLAVGAAVAHGSYGLGAAGLMFFASDISVARNRFVKRDFVNKLWGLPVYYGAQVAFAWVVVALRPSA